MSHLRFNPPPGWPPPPAGWLPPTHWQPPADWPAAPAGWDYLLELADEPHPQYAATPHPGYGVTTPRRATPPPAPAPATFYNQEDDQPDAYDLDEELYDRLRQTDRRRLVTVLLVTMLTMLAVGAFFTARTTPYSKAMDVCGQAARAAIATQTGVPEPAANQQVAAATQGVRSGIIFRTISGDNDSALTVTGDYTTLEGEQWRFTCDVNALTEPATVLDITTTAPGE